MRPAFARSRSAALAFVLIVVAGVAAGLVIGAYATTTSSSADSFSQASATSSSLASASSTATSVTSIETSNSSSSQTVLQFAVTVDSQEYQTLNIPANGWLWQKLLVIVHSSVVSNISLTLSGLPSGVWAKLVPSSLVNVGPNGTRDILLLAGATVPRGDCSVPTSSTFTIAAISTDGSSAAACLPIDVRAPAVSVLRSPGPIIEPGISALRADYTTGNTDDVLCVVYDPSYPQESTTLNVSLSATGLIGNGTLAPIPSWMKVDFSASSFVLNSSQPYFYAISVDTNPVHVGTYTISLRSVVEGEAFNSTVTFVSQVATL